MRLARDERQDMVRILTDQGMSQRDIAPIVGAGVGTVHRDQAATAPNGAVAADGPTARAVVGHDGRTRTWLPPPSECR